MFKSVRTYGLADGNIITTDWDCGVAEWINNKQRRAINSQQYNSNKKVDVKIPSANTRLNFKPNGNSILKITEIGWLGGCIDT